MRACFDATAGSDRDMLLANMSQASSTALHIFESRSVMHHLDPGSLSPDQQFLVFGGGVVELHENEVGRRVRAIHITGVLALSGGAAMCASFFRPLNFADSPLMYYHDNGTL